MNYQITKNNHVKWGYRIDNQDHTYTSEVPPSDATCWIEFGNPSRPHSGLHQEAVRAAREIADSSSLPIMLALSGGLDSQVMTLSFIEARIPFETLIIRYEIDGKCLNEHDISLAYEFCKIHQIIPVEERFDPRTCWTYQGYEKTIKENLLWTYLAHTLYLIHAKYGQQYNVICGGGDPMLYPNSDGTWQYYHQTIPHSHHLINLDCPGTTKFYWWSPELLAAQIDTPFMHQWARAIPSYVKSQLWYTEKSLRQPRPYSAELYHDFCKPAMWVNEFPEVIQAKKHMGNENFTEVLGRDFMLGLIANYKEWWDFYFSHEISLPWDDIISWARKTDGEVTRWTN